MFKKTVASFVALSFLIPISAYTYTDNEIKKRLEILIKRAEKCRAPQVIDDCLKLRKEDVELLKEAIRKGFIPEKLLTEIQKIADSLKKEGTDPRKLTMEELKIKREEAQRQNSEFPQK